MNKRSSSVREIKIINCAEIADKDWTFLKDRIKSLNIAWYFHSATPNSWLERVVRRPNLARFRSCILTALQAKFLRADFIVSHLPRTTVWVAIFSWILGVKARHLAYSFNFTELPTGKMKAIMMFAYSKVDRFVVYSTAEKSLYSGYFNIPENRIDVIKWSMDVPHFDGRFQESPGEYVCAVGGEGRDYDLLLEVAEALKEVTFIVVARSNSIVDKILPPNVHLYINIPVYEYWNIVAKSKFVIVPLKTATTNCGHITIVGSHLLLKPVVSTISSGTSDYLENGMNSLLSPVRNVDAMCENIRSLWSDKELLKKLEVAITKKNKEYNLENWVEYFEKYIQRSFC